MIKMIIEHTLVKCNFVVLHCDVLQNWVFFKLTQTNVLL